MEFAEAKACEISNLKDAINTANETQNSRVFQSLPRHMRRRAASHDIRRVPKRLHLLANSKEVRNLCSK